MAVGYQYQNEFNQKEDKKGFKKKLIILGAGLALLVVITIIGAPKKEQPLQTTSKPVIESPVLDKDLSKTTDELNDEQKNTIAKIKKIHADKFLESVSSSDDINEFIPDFLADPTTKNSAFLKNLKTYYSKDCVFLDADWPDDFIGNNVVILSYKCSAGYLYIAAYRYYDFKFFNWVTSEEPNEKIILKKIGGGS